MKRLLTASVFILIIVTCKSQNNIYDSPNLKHRSDLENLFESNEPYFLKKENSLLNLSIERINKKYGTTLITKTNFDQLLRVNSKDPRNVISENKHAFKQKMDSVILDGYSKETNFKNIYTYDENGLLSSLTRFYINLNTGYESLSIRIAYTNEEFDYSEETSKWDSILGVWIPKFKAYQSWDMNGLITEYRNMFWDESTEKWITKLLVVQNYDSIQNIYIQEQYKMDDDMNKLVGIYKFSLKVNKNDDILEDINYLWNLDLEEWDFFYKKAYEYTDFNKPNIYRFYFWKNEEWESIVKGEYEYDGNHNEILLTMYEFNEKLILWEQYAKKEKKYTQSNLIKEEASYQWNFEDSVWNYDEKYEMTYYSNDNIDNVIYSYWDMELNILLKSKKFSYQFNSNNLITSYITQHWDATLQFWLNSSKHEYNYDSNLNNTLRSIYNWEDSTLGWRGRILQKFLFDEFGNQLHSESFNWNITNWNWIGSSKSEYEYDYTYRIDELSMPFVLNFWKNKPVFHYDYYWDTTINNWSEKIKATYYYSDWETSVQEIENLSLKIYPNPATKILNIQLSNDISSISVYNIKGVFISKKSNIKSNITNINVSFFSKGVYLIEISSSNKTLIRKFIIE